MQLKKTIIFIGVLVVLTALAAVIHLSTRAQIPEHSIQVTQGDKKYHVDITKLDYDAVSGVRVNGKGEEIAVSGDGIALHKLLLELGITDFSKVNIVADDSYRAELLAEEVKEENRAYLMLEEDTLRLVVFEDENSKRSVSDVVEICVE